LPKYKCRATETRHLTQGNSNESRRRGLDPYAGENSTLNGCTHPTRARAQTSTTTRTRVAATRTADNLGGCDCNLPFSLHSFFSHIVLITKDQSGPGSVPRLPRELQMQKNIFPKMFKISPRFCRSISVTTTKPHGERQWCFKNKLWTTKFCTRWSTPVAAIRLFF
jgi:hypothetical protein